MPSDLEKQSGELVVYAARLVRAIRRRVGHPAGIRILALLDELGPQGVTALAEVDRVPRSRPSPAPYAIWRSRAWSPRRPTPTTHVARWCG
ncbi:hypothetical protein [Nocardioides cynanchi]|uniref:hypothetical protein n=1 Tax=Nocardioides cynanchi TaxID=2558918 RepID=UPI00192D29A5|nr:hypothetical protein [Nocardioides cynanchi]